MLHGRLLSALAAAAAQREHGGDGFHLARITVDLFRAPSMAPLEVEIVPVRMGGRVRAADVTFTSEERPVARATALLLRQTAEPAGTAWSAPSWTVPGPDELTLPERTGEGPFPIDIRSLAQPDSAGTEPQRIWVQEVRDLVEGEGFPPVARVAAAADISNWLVNHTDLGLSFINADVSVSTSRPPVSQWIGLDVTGRCSATGISVGDCALYDVAGPIGFCSIRAVATEAFAGA
jgi:hypothetical protein